jgi:VanZ family protein
LAWICIVALAMLALLPATDVPQTGFPNLVNHLIAYAGSSLIAVAAYHRKLRSELVIVAICCYAGILEYLQTFAPGRHPAVEDFAASVIGTVCGGAAAALLGSRLWKFTADQP